MSLAWNLKEFPSQHVGDSACFQEVTLSWLDWQDSADLLFDSWTC
jgi:hypothetical protein